MVSRITLLVPKTSSARPAGIGASLIKNDVPFATLFAPFLFAVSLTNSTSAVTVEPLKFANRSPTITVVVLLGTVYMTYAVPAEAGSAANDTTLNVFAIIFSYYPNAIARAVAPPSVYVLMSVIATCFMVPLSFTTTLSASANVVPVADVSPSIIFSSAAVESTAANLVKSACTKPETPSNKFSSAAVDVIAVPLIASLAVTTLKVPLSSILATSVPSLCWNIRSLASTIGLIMTSLDEFVIFKTSVPPDLKLQSLPAASNIMSPAESIKISVSSLIIESTAMLPTFVILASPKEAPAENTDASSAVILPTCISA